jgi:hypothetical protein
MTEHGDERIGELLRSDAPAAHDPMFRLAVMERRERRRFRNRSLQVLGGGLAVAAVVLAGMAIGWKALEAAGFLVFTGLAVAVYFYRPPQIEQILRRFRS